MEATKFVQSRTASEILDEVCAAAEALVDREEARLCSRGLAYESVGDMVGLSGMSVRRLVNRYPGAGLNFVVGCNIMALYERVSRKME